MKLRYHERCILKAERLLDELIDELDSKHAFKLIATVWGVTESLLRAIVYLHTGTTYERPQRLISELDKRGLCEKRIVTLLRMIYVRRNRVMHQAVLPEWRTAEAVLKCFLRLAPELIKILSEHVDTSNLEEKLKRLLRHLGNSECRR